MVVDMNHVGVIVDNMEVSKKFYEEIIGGRLEHTYENENVQLAFYRVGSGVVELVKRKHVSHSRNLGVVEHIAFTVDNIEESIEGLKRNNIRLISDNIIPMENKLLFFFEGPNGEKLEYVQYVEIK
jgi:lactoylglutathione lyase